MLKFARRFPRSRSPLSRRTMFSRRSTITTERRIVFAFWVRLSKREFFGCARDAGKDRRKIDAVPSNVNVLDKPHFCAAGQHVQVINPGLVDRPLGIVWGGSETH
jgi:hypothetical protein